MRPDFDFYVILTFILLTMLINSKGYNNFTQVHNKHKEEIHRIDNSCKGKE